MSQVTAQQPQVAILRVNQANVFRSAAAALGKGPVPRAAEGLQKGHTVIDPARISEIQHDGPVISVTMSEAIPRRVPAFLRASRPVEQQVLTADGMLWTMGFFKPPMWFATISIWQSGAATDAFAYSEARGAAHLKAIPGVHEWFRRSTTMRFRPYAVMGSLSGSHELDGTLLSPP